MLQTTQTLPHHLNKLDSLQAQVNHLNQVVDSLNKVSEANTIYTGFFHDIINSQVMTFILIITIIIAIASAISWAWLNNRFGIIETQRQNDLNLQRETNESLFKSIEEKLKTLELDHEGLQARANMMLYELLRKENRYEEALVWGLGSILSSIEIENFEAVKGNIKVLRDDLNSRQLNKERVEENGVEVMELIKLIQTKEKFEQKDTLLEIEKKYFAVYYS